MVRNFVIAVRPAVVAMYDKKMVGFTQNAHGSGVQKSWEMTHGRPLPVCRLDRRRSVGHIFVSQT